MGLVATFVESQRGAETLLDACRSAVQRHLPAIWAAPIDLLAFARSKGINVHYTDGLPYEGMIEHDAIGKSDIYVRNGASLRRRRFTLAHELGHWILKAELEPILGPMKGRLFRGLALNNDEVREEEKLANLLAAELLLPAEIIQATIDVRCDRLMSKLRDICRRFQVSRVAAIRRIADVLDLNIVFVEFVPHRFHDLDSFAEVDEAVFASAGESTLYDNDCTRLWEREPFRRFVQSERLTVGMSTPKGSFAVALEVDYSPQPVPHAYGLAFLDRNWNSSAYETRNVMEVTRRGMGAA